MPIPTPHPAADDAMLAVAARAASMMGEPAVARLTPERAAAWEGLLEVGRRLRRGAEALIEERHGLGVSTLGVLGRLTRAPDQALHQTDIAAGMGLSVSRISRIVDVLQARGLVRRTACPDDGRAINVTLTPEGATLARAAQDTIHTYVTETFLDRVDDREAAVLAAVFTRLISDGAPVGGTC